MQELSLANIQLTVDEYAKIRGVTARYVRMLCDNKELESKIITKQKGGKSGKVYLIPLAKLPEREIKRYLKAHKISDLLDKGKEDSEKIIDLSYESLSNKEREELNIKNKILDGWNKYKLEEKARGVNSSEAMNSYMVEYAESHNLSISQLIRMGVELQMKHQSEK